MKKVIALLLAVALCAAAFAAPLDLTLANTVNASAYTASASAVKTIRILSIDYQNGVCRFQLLDAGGTAYGSGAVFGINDPAINESNAQAKIVALISGG